LDHASEGSASEVAGPGPVASVAAPPDFVSPLSLAPSDNAGAQALSGLNQVVTPSLAVARSPASLDSPLNAQADGFRITRAPVSNATTEVRYALTAFSSAGAVRREYATTIPSGAVHVDVLNEPTPAGKANGREIVTLTLLDHSAYRISRPSVTLFLAGNAQGCSEPALFAAYQEGKVAEAFSALVARHRPAVLQTCFGVLGNWHDAEDVTQMVFLALTQQQLRLQTTLASWLRTVARNASIALLRSRARRSRHEYRGAKPILVASEEPIRDLREHLDAALNQLSAPLREAVQLRYLEGWSQREAAQILGCPRGTLAQRASLGVRHLRGILSQGHESADND
jgi:RNA polymerase sigma-70 factor (ECF subfamily)